MCWGWLVGEDGRWMEAAESSRAHSTLRHRALTLFDRTHLKSRGRRASQKPWARALPMACTKATCSGSQVSCGKRGTGVRPSLIILGKAVHQSLSCASCLTRFVDRTLLLCTPKLRCTPGERGGGRGVNNWHPGSSTMTCHPTPGRSRPST